MQAARVEAVLAGAKVGQELVFSFDCGQGKNGDLSHKERIAIVQFLSLAEGPYHPVLDIGDEGYEKLNDVVQDGCWGGQSRLYWATVKKPISREDAAYFAERIAGILDSVE